MPEETRARIARLQQGSAAEKLQARVLMLVYMLGLIQGDAEHHGVRPTPEVIADLLVEDLGSGAELRSEVPKAIAALAEAGAVIDQMQFPITPYDTSASLYDRVAVSNRDMILRLLPRLLRGERPGTPQPRADAGVLPRRRPADGLITWDQDARAVYNFVRALTKPYPGAFGWLDGRRWLVWHAALLPGNGTSYGPPGEILGPVLSPVEQACGQVVACRHGAVAVLEAEAEDGAVLRGRRLAEQPWTGRRWTASGQTPA